MKLFFTFLFLLFSVYGQTQGIYVDLSIERLSPLITSYSKTEVEGMMRDSIMAKLRRGYVEKIENERRITFNQNDEHDYVVEFILTDTVNLNIEDSIQTPERLRLVRLASMLYKIYEKDLAVSLIPKPQWFGVGYSDYNGNLQQGETEKDVIRTYSSWLGSVFSTSALTQIPYLNSYTLRQFNVSQEESKKFDYFKEVLITKTNFDSSKRVAIIDRLLTDALLSEQEFYYGVRSQKDNYINIYDSYNDTFTDHPLSAELVLSRKEKGYKIRLIVDKNLITQHANYHVPTEIEFSDEQLEQAPSQVLRLIHDIFKKLFRLNLE